MMIDKEMDTLFWEDNEGQCLMINNIMLSKSAE